MKPFRLDAPFSESARISEKALVPLESSSALTVEKAVITSGPLSSLLPGEKIQSGAVTSPTPIPPNSRSLTPLSPVRTGSPLDSSHIPGHSSSFVTNFLESPLDASFSLKADSASKDDGFEGKVADLELEAEPEAAASAVVAAAISSEDPVESHANTRVSEINAGCTTLLSANLLTAQIQNNLASDNPMAVALLLSLHRNASKLVSRVFNEPLQYVGNHATAATQWSSGISLSGDGSFDWRTSFQLWST